MEISKSRIQFYDEIYLSNGETLLPVKHLFISHCQNISTTTTISSKIVKSIYSFHNKRIYRWIIIEIILSKINPNIL